MWTLLDKISLEEDTHRFTNGRESVSNIYATYLSHFFLLIFLVLSDLAPIMILHFIHEETSTEILNNLPGSHSYVLSELGFDPWKFGSKVYTFNSILPLAHPMTLIAQR